MNPYSPRAIPKYLTAAWMLMSSVTTAHAGTFTIDCALNDGSKFILRAEYSRNFLPGHHGPYTPKGYWEIFYKSKNSFREKQAPGSIDFSRADCTQVGLLNGTPIVQFSFLDKQGNWFNTDLLPEAVFSDASPQTQPPEIKEKLLARNLFIPYMEGFVVPFGSMIVYEAPVLNTKAGDRNGIVTAVLQTISSDNGNTWSKPDITASARIYELGKSPKAQTFYGKLTKSTVPH
jgi:hypothetical protein